MKEKFYKMLQKLRKESFGTWAYKKQVEAMEDRLLKLSEEQDLRDRVDRLFEIHLLRMGWRNFFLVVLLCQFLVLAGNRFWFFILLLCT
jgi:hypothetical protein